MAKVATEKKKPFISVDAAKTSDGDAVTKKMTELPINDMYKKGTIRPQDGRDIHDMYLLQVKSTAESKTPWDYYKVVRKIPGTDAFASLADSKRPLVKK